MSRHIQHACRRHEIVVLQAFAIACAQALTTCSDLSSDSCFGSVTPCSAPALMHVQTVAFLLLWHVAMQSGPAPAITSACRCVMHPSDKHSHQLSAHGSIQLIRCKDVLLMQADQDEDLALFRNAESPKRKGRPAKKAPAIKKGSKAAKSNSKRKADAPAPSQKPTQKKKSTRSKK